MTSTDPASDDAKLSAYAEDLTRALHAHTLPWVERVIGERLGADQASERAAELADEIQRVLDEVGALLVLDIDAQQANPLAIVRSLVPALTSVLRRHGAHEAARDRDAERLFPDDVFDVTPGSFSDIHPDLHMPGLAWGAAKAHVHLQRRRAEGLR